MDANILGPKVFLLWSMFSSSACGIGHFENVALNKACNMSSQYGNTNDRHPPEAVANGNTNGSYLGTTNCIHTAGNDSAPWWQVDLGRMYSVHRIVVWARTAEIPRMKGCAIYVDEEECYRFDTVPDRKTNVTCGSGVLRGRIVKVSKNTTGLSGGNITINICEVQVLSCRNNSWGSGCDMRCGNCSNGEVCDKVTGHCSSCPLGLQPPLCDTGCRNDYWGSGCDMRCGNCSNGEVCDKVTGHCSSCPLGLQPPLCDTDCAHRTFGHSCTQTCSEGCEDVCDKVSGNCTCKPGWLGPACGAECPVKTYGMNCMQNCSDHCSDTCDKATGHCACNRGYGSPLCLTGEEPPSTTGFPVGAVVGSVCALVVLVIVAVFLVRWLRSRSLVNKEERATDAASHGTGSTQNSSLSDHRNPVTLSSIQSDNVYEAVEGEVNHGYNNPSECSSAIPANVLEVESSGELPMESSAPSNDQPNEIVDRDRENTYEQPRMYVNTGDHHVYSDLNI